MQTSSPFRFLRIQNSHRYNANSSCLVTYFWGTFPVSEFKLKIL
nr:MAG TPA: hypothetical protein [Caudoviricetes sp.]